MQMDGVVREISMGVLGRGLSVVGVEGEEYHLSHLLFADDTALVVSSEELSRLVHEFTLSGEHLNLQYTT